MSETSIVFIGDVHNRVEVLKRAVAAVPAAAALGFVGDFVDMRDPTLFERSTVDVGTILELHTSLIDYLNTIGNLCYYVLGNHDPVAFSRKLGSQWRHLDLAIHKLPGTDIKLGGIGGSHMVPSNLPTGAGRAFREGVVHKSLSGMYSSFEFAKYEIQIEGIAKILASKVPGELAMYDLDPPNVLVTHTPPVLPKERTLTWDILDWKSFGLARSIEHFKPMVIVSGHLHEPRPPSYEWTHTDGRRTLCLQTGELTPNSPLWSLEFKDAASPPAVRQSRW
nr:metallophosphoesterase [Candidatus Sigynarchaeota archaeon]